MTKRDTFLEATKRREEKVNKALIEIIEKHSNKENKEESLLEMLKDAYELGKQN